MSDQAIDLLADALDTLTRVSEELDHYVDVVDGDYGHPAPNWAMSLQQECNWLCERIDKLRAATLVR